MDILGPVFIVLGLISLGLAVRKRYFSKAPEPTSPSAASVTPDLHDHDWRARLAAVRALAERGDESTLPDLLDALRDSDNDVREAAGAAVVHLGAAAIPGLLETLRADSIEARTVAARSLGRIGDSAAVEGLVAALDDVSAWVRCPAAEALGRIGDPAAVNPLGKALNDKDADVRECAANALRQIGTRDALAALD